MSREAIRLFHENYYCSDEFRAWQNVFADEIYSSLRSKIKSGEIATVTNLCDVMSDKQYRGLRIESKKLHSRSTSGVSFNYKGESATTELADMVIVSVVTFDRKIVLLKTAFIQNKKATANKKMDSWIIDPKQLFLLKNFPTFTGVSGVFNKMTKTFINHSDTLGNYGLFTSDGEMIFLTARNVYCNQSEGGSINSNDIKKASPRLLTQSNYANYHCKRKCCCDFNGEYGYGDNQAFFNNYSYALDVHEIVRGLTYFNIGEPSSAYGRITNNELYEYTEILLKSAFGHSVGDNHFNRDYQFSDKIVFENDITVVLNHVELGENYKYN